MISAYLTALADLCDKHGTHAKHMGPELRLLAGLPWGECANMQPCPRCDGKGHEGGPFPEGRLCTFCGGHERIGWRVHPADVARGFLVCSRAPGPIWKGPHMLVDERRYNVVTERAAACAELAVMSTRWTQAERVVTGPPRLAEPRRGDRTATGIMTGPTETITFHQAHPCDGTIDGARAAWSWISSQLLVVESLGRAGCIFSTDPTRPFDAAFQNKIADGARVYAETYRRELEAMK